MMKNARLRPLAQGLHTVAKFVAAPFIGLAYIIVLPFAGLAALAWFAAKAAFARRETD
jgi:hypothetical protein